MMKPPSEDFASFAAGGHPKLWELLGAHVLDGDDRGCRFRVWAPNAQRVRVIGDWTFWTGGDELWRREGTGVWEGFSPYARPGQRYKFEVTQWDGVVTQRADPMARATEVPPANASVICGRSEHRWSDGQWMAGRERQDLRRMRIYEVHAGSWRADLHNYRDLAEPLALHARWLGFTHVELLPVSEYPYGPSWGYQVTGYYAPTARYGTTDDFRAFVDIMHAHGIGVIVDWVPAHFPRDPWALARFDGTALYEYADPRRGEQLDWGTLVFDLGRPEVSNFLVGSALHWLDEYHVDGLRVDAVASMLYRDYSRPHGGWEPNIHGGREDLEAIAFFRHLNGTIGHHHPGVMVIAEESTSFPGVTDAPDRGGLGFTHKWNMGWMNDTLRYLAIDSIHRRWEHHLLTFGLVYAFTERFILPLSHDEVVHGKGSLYGKMPGDDWQRLATLRTLYAWMYALPGNPLLFMGAELAVSEEWNESHALLWSALDHPPRRGLAELLGELGRVSDECPALWQRDTDPGGFQWLAADDSEHSVYAFLRWGDEGWQAVACVANFTPIPHPGYRLGLPWAGTWSVALDTDSTSWWGSGFRGSATEYVTEEVGAHGQAHSVVLDLPPLAMVWLVARST